MRGTELMTKEGLTPSCAELPIVLRLRDFTSAKGKYAASATSPLPSSLEIPNDP